MAESGHLATRKEYPHKRPGGDLHEPLSQKSIPLLRLTLAAESVVDQEYRSAPLLVQNASSSLTSARKGPTSARTSAATASS